jgi:hypothetical protein
MKVTKISSVALSFRGIFCNAKCMHDLIVFSFRVNRSLLQSENLDVVEWSRALDVRLREWCRSVSMVWVQIPSREEQKFDSSKI